MSANAAEYLSDAAQRFTRINTMLPRVQQAIMEYRQIMATLTDWDVRYGKTMGELLELQKDVTYLQRMAEQMAKLAVSNPLEEVNAALSQATPAKAPHTVGGKPAGQPDTWSRSPRGRAAPAGRLAALSTLVSAGHDAANALRSSREMLASGNGPGDVLNVLTPAFPSPEIVGPQQEAEPRQSPSDVLIPLTGPGSIWMRHFAPDVSGHLGRGFVQPGFGGMVSFGVDLRDQAPAKLATWPTGFYRNREDARQQFLIQTNVGFVCIDGIEDPNAVPVAWLLKQVSPDGNTYHEGIPVTALEELNQKRLMSGINAAFLGILEEDKRLNPENWEK